MPKNQCPKPYRQFMSRFGEYLNVSSKALLQLFCLLTKLKEKFLGDKNEKTLYELINCETWNGSFDKKKVIHK